MENVESRQILDPCFDPGAARYGNFINYYSFNTVESRIKAIPSNLLEEFNLINDPIVCLDVGCNAGDLTNALYTSLQMTCENLGKKLFIIGVDIDEVLITRCTEYNAFPSNVSYYHLDIMDENSLETLHSYLLPHNKEKFDLVTCFSTTMWIHLNHGDEGLLDFLNYICDIAKLILIEPQEWKSYKSAARRTKRLNCKNFNLNDLKQRHIPAFIDSVFCTNHVQKVTSCETSWGRELYFYKQTNIS